MRSCKSIKIINHERGGPKEPTYYILEIKLTTNILITTKKRYKDLHELNSSLKKEFKESKINTKLSFPTFPGKKYFFNTDEEFLKMRQQQLNKYFSNLLKENIFVNLPSFLKWIDTIIQEEKEKKKDRKNFLGEKNTEEIITQGAIDLFHEFLYDMEDETNNMIDEKVKNERNQKYTEIIEKNGLFSDISDNNKNNNGNIKKVIPEGNDCNFRLIGEYNKHIKKIENEVQKKLEDYTEKIEKSLNQLYESKDLILEFKI